MIDHDPSAPPWTAQTSEGTSGTERRRSADANTQESPQPRSKSTDYFRDTVDFYFDRKITETRLAPRGTIKTILHYLRLSDPDCRLFSADRTEEWECPDDIPGSPDEMKDAMQYQKIRKGKARQHHVFTMYLETNKRVVEHRAYSEGLRRILDDEKVWMRARTLGSASTRVLGWFAGAHPGATNHQDFERQIVEILRGVEADNQLRDEWESELKANERLAYSRGGNPVPPVRIFQSKKWCRGNKKEKQRDVTLVALQIKTASKHHMWVTHLLCRASKLNVLPGRCRFIPHHVQSDNISLPGIVKGHFTVTQNTKVIPVVGLSKEAADIQDKDKKTYRAHLVEKLRAVSLQPTSRTADIGKWLVLVHTSNYQTAIKYIDEVLPEEFKRDVPHAPTLTGFPHPRRTRVPMRAVGSYADTLRSLGEAGLTLPEVAPTKIKKKPKQVSFVTNPEAFPELQPTKKKKATQATEEARTPGSTNESSLQEKIEEMEKRHTEKLAQVEKRHKDELDDLMISIQNQFDSSTVTMEASIANSHKTICKMVADNHEKLTRRVNELIKVVNLLSLNTMRQADSAMTEVTVEDLTGDRPVLVEPQLKKKPREASENIPRGETALESVEVGTKNRVQRTPEVRTDVKTPPTGGRSIRDLSQEEDDNPHTTRGAYETQHLWR